MISNGLFKWKDPLFEIYQEEHKNDFKKYALSKKAANKRRKNKKVKK